MITTRELADLAGVNQSTVSRSLNNLPGVSQKTRERILQLAKDAGYPLKRNKIRGNRDDKSIAVLLSENFFTRYTDHFLESLIYSILEELDAAGFYPVVTYDKHNGQGTEKIEDLIAGSSTSGVIIVNREFSSDLDRYLKGLEIPHIYLQYFNQSSCEEINIVDVNHIAGGYIAAQHLIGKGHKKILVITSPGREFIERTRGFRNAMGEAGLDYCEDDIVTIEHNYDAGYEFASSNLDKIGRYTGIFAENDLSAIGIINALQDSGVNVPGDLSVIGYDDIDAGRFCRPTLTTVKQPVKELAQAGVKRLGEIIQTEDTNQLQIYIQPRLILRGSTKEAD